MFMFQKLEPFWFLLFTLIQKKMVFSKEYTVELAKYEDG